MGVLPLSREEQVIAALQEEAQLLRAQHERERAELAEAQRKGEMRFEIQRDLLEKRLRDREAQLRALQENSQSAEARAQSEQELTKLYQTELAQKTQLIEGLKLDLQQLRQAQAAEAEREKHLLEAKEREALLRKEAAQLRLDLSARDKVVRNLERDIQDKISVLQER